MKQKKYLWMKVSDDKYEFPLVIADTSRELAAKVGSTSSSIVGTIKRHGDRSRYKKIEVTDDD